MTQVWPLRFRELNTELLFGNESGSWFISDRSFLDRYANDTLSRTDLEFLKRRGNAFERENDLSYSSYLRRWAGRHASKAPSISYVILVPTLRCNLSCDYCQVSRAAENAKGYDWTEETLEETLQFLDQLTTTNLKVEFQGGEPLLRLDILERVRDFCRGRFEQSSFVVCSNFQNVSDAVWTFFEAEDTYLSTSIDGDVSTHSRQRTGSLQLTADFLANVETFLARFGPERISALPTIDLDNPVDLDDLIDTYAGFGLHSLYLRPVNRQGFARRKPPTQNEVIVWSSLHERFVWTLIERNAQGGPFFEEFYFTHALRRVLRMGIDNHVDIRNPALMADSYLVVDHDGTLYPTDEARMMSRVGQIDLSIGSIGEGIDREKVRALNAWSFNDLDPDCQHCVYQPYCGTDVVDDVSRYGRIDVSRAETWFCQRHLSLFDLVFNLIKSTDPKVHYSMARWAGIEVWPASFAEVFQ